MQRCMRGHYYDEIKYTACPYCGVQNLNIQPTVGQSLTPPVKPHGQPGETVAMVKKQTGFDPVVGWLVCINGPEKGRDYRIRNEKNSLGRSEQMDIYIAKDETISRENHAFVVYNSRKRSFRVQAGESRGLVYLNDEEVMTYAELKPYDVLEVGQTSLLFIPLCGERFEWDQKD